MTHKEILSLGRWLSVFLLLFADCFVRSAGRALLGVYIRGLLSNTPRKNAEAIALDQAVAPRTVQRFLECIKWDEQRVRDRCQQIVATQHADPEAIGIIDETGTAKSGAHTVGAKRQYNGNRGKVENCVVNVALSYATGNFQALVDVQLYLPEDWANDPERRKETYVPDEVQFQTKPQIALQQIDRALANGIRVKAWTCDELYGRDIQFLDGLDKRGQAFVGEVAPDFRVWLDPPTKPRKPRQEQPSEPCRSSGKPKPLPRLSRSRRTSQVRHLRRHSPAFHQQKPQRYRVKDGARGPEVWEIQWHICWRRTRTPAEISRRCTLIVARNALTGEIKYFLSNRTPDQPGWSLRGLLRIAFSRWNVEDCFREAKEELGFDHFQCRGWRCLQRHMYCEIVSHLFCARVRQRLCPTNDVLAGQLLTMEQVRRAAATYLQTVGPAHRTRQQRLDKELRAQCYYQRRNATAARSHRKTRYATLRALGIEPDRIKSCIPNDHSQ